MRLIFLIVVLVVSLSAFAQTDSTVITGDTTITRVDSTVVITDTTVAPASTAVAAMPVSKDPTKKTYPKNVVKMNVTSLLFKNYNFALERSLTRKISALVWYRTMSTTQLSQLPALKKIYKAVGEDQNTLDNDWKDLSASGKAATLEFRFYGGRKPGPRGFYFGVYGRWAHYDVDYNYVYETDVKSYSIPIQSSAKGLGVGAYSGVQWLIGKRVALDWQIFGGHWGKLTGDGSGTADLSELSAQDKQQIKEDLEDKLPAFGDKNTVTADVSNNGVHVKVDGPFIGIRSAISLGISF